MADFNADGLLDLAAANRYSQDISILMGQGFGFFSSAVNYGVGLNPQSITAADFNGDGSPDIAINNDNSNNVYILTSTIVTLTVTSANSICIGNNVSLVASSNINNYVWSTGATSSSISVSPLINTSYTVTNTNIQGCSIKAVKTISVNPCRKIETGRILEWYIYR